MHRLELVQRTQWHDQFILYQVVRQAPRDGYDFAAMEKATRLVRLFRADEFGAPIDQLTNGQPRDFKAIPWRPFVVIEDADWDELCAKFRAHRWAVYEEEIIALGKAIFAAPIVTPGEAPADAARQHPEPAGNGQLPAGV